MNRSSEEDILEFLQTRPNSEDRDEFNIPADEDSKRLPKTQQLWSHCNFLPTMSTTQRKARENMDNDGVIAKKNSIAKPTQEPKALAQSALVPYQPHTHRSISTVIFHKTLCP
jgi:hypothetical protein